MMVYETENSTTFPIKLKWGFHFEKKDVMLFHLMVEVFQVVIALIWKFVKKIRLQINLSCRGPLN